MVNCVELVTVLVVTGNVALVDPAGTVTFGTTTWASPVLLLARLTTAPSVGAGPLSVTVPVDPDPPTTLAGFRVIERTTIGGTPPYTAWYAPAIAANVA